MPAAVFDYTAWSTLYPEFGAVTQQRAALLFDQAGLYLDNTDASPVSDVTRRLMLLNMITAHLAQLSGGLGAGGLPAGTVGRVSEASEGTVRVKVDLGNMSELAAWYAQTPYGFQYWQATKGFRSATYVAPCPYNFEPVRGRAWRG